MLINISVSLGELLDKISILIIKQKNITERGKLENINKELETLNDTLKNYLKEQEFDFYLKSLLSINTKLWKIEDDIRECERQKKFDQKFVDLARSVYFTNDERAATGPAKAEASACTPASPIRLQLRFNSSSHGRPPAAAAAAMAAAPSSPKGLRPSSSFTSRSSALLFRTLRSAGASAAVIPLSANQSELMGYRRFATISGTCG